MRTHHLLTALVAAFAVGCGGGSGGGGGTPSPSPSPSPPPTPILSTNGGDAASPGGNAGDISITAGGDIYVFPTSTAQIAEEAAFTNPSPAGGAGALEVGASETSRLTPGTRTYSSVRIEGTLELSAADHYTIISEGDVLISGTINFATAATSSSSLTIRAATSALHDCAVTGVIDLTGPAAALNIGTGGSFDNIRISGTLDTSGGAGQAGGDIDIVAESLLAVDNGLLVADGGAGASGAFVNLTSNAGIVVVRSERVQANGGSATDTSAAGAGGNIDLVSDTSITVDGLVESLGGDAAAGAGGAGGEIDVRARTNSTSTTISVAGTISSRGGSSTSGAAGDAGEVQLILGFSGSPADTVTISGTLESIGGATDSGTAGDSGVVIVRVDAASSTVTVAAGGLLQSISGSATGSGTPGDANGGVYVGAGGIPGSGNPYEVVAGHELSVAAGGTVSAGDGTSSEGVAGLADFNVATLTLLAGSALSADSGTNSGGSAGWLLTRTSTFTTIDDQGATLSSDAGATFVRRNLDPR